MAEPHRPSLIPALAYQDPRVALAWLQTALGFELCMLIEDEAGAVAHAELRFGEAVIMVGGEWSDDHQSPRSIGGKNSQTVHIQIAGDIHAHCARAAGNGAEILMAPELQFYGDMVYRCRDPEGHIWTVSETVDAVSREQAEAASGLKITGWI